MKTLLIIVVSLLFFWLSAKFICMTIEEKDSWKNR